jgi:hypothetical protein
VAGNWRAMVRAPGLQLDGDAVIVQVSKQRSHRVVVQELESTLALHAVVARAAAVEGVVDLVQRLWRHNRGAQFVSFRLDHRGRVCAEGWVPKVGLTAQELQLVIRRVAAESDQLEFLLTGEDVR